MPLQVLDSPVVCTVTVKSNPNTIATATATLATTGSLATVTLNTGASLYTAAPTVALVDLVVVLLLLRVNGSRVAEIEVVAGGTGYAGLHLLLVLLPTIIRASSTTVDLVANTITINNIRLKLVIR